MTTTQITTAMTLAAGFGKRMRPLTDDRPKPMVSLAGQPMIDHVLERLAKAGIEHTIVNLHYQADMLESYLATRKQKPAISFSNERRQILDTGGGIKHALPLIGHQPFILHNSDSVWIEHETDNLAALLAHYDADTMDALLLMAPINTSLGYDGPGDFFIKEQGRLRRRTQDETSPNVFTGVSVLHPRLFQDSPDGPFSVNLLWDRAMREGRVYGIPFEGQWMHVGTPDALIKAQKVIQDARK
ncbi:MAG: nucleotidyltransferase family protein [bacterium]|nr:nucleotidyltransferase family protein [bacterium]